LRRANGTVLEPSLLDLPYDAKAAEWYAAERARLTSAGRTPAFVDGQIAAAAAVNRLAVVTLNRPHFTPFHGSRSRRFDSGAGASPSVFQAVT
jgi:predicted nucleic acid-binding protein